MFNPPILGLKTCPYAGTHKYETIPAEPFENLLFYQCFIVAQRNILLMWRSPLMEIVEKFTSKQRKCWNAYSLTWYKIFCFLRGLINIYSLRPQHKLKLYFFKKKSGKNEGSAFGSFIFITFYLITQIRNM